MDRDPMLPEIVYDREAHRSICPSRMPGGKFASDVIWRVRAHPIGNSLHGRSDDVEASPPIGFTQSMRIVNMRTSRPAPQAE